MYVGMLHISKDTKKIFKVVRNYIILYIHCYLIFATSGKGFNLQSQ